MTLNTAKNTYLQYEMEEGRVALCDLSWEHARRVTLYASADDRESAMRIDLGLQIQVSE